MSVGMGFNSGVNTVDIQSTGDTRAQRQMSNIDSIGNQSPDYLKTLQTAANTSATIVNAYNVGQTNGAKEAALNLTMDKAYRDGSDTIKFGMIESAVQDSTSQSKAYQAAFKGYIASEYNKTYDGSQVELVDSGLNAAPSDWTAWNESYSDVPAGDNLEDGMLTNREAGKTHADWTEDYIKRFPYMKDSKVGLNLALIKESHMILLNDIQNARTPEDIARAQGDAADRNEGFKTPLLLNSRSSKIKTAVNEASRQVSAAIKAKEKGFKDEAVTTVELTKNLSTENELQKYSTLLPESTFVTAYGAQAPQKYQEYLNNYNKYEESRLKYFDFNSNETVDWTGENEVTQKMYQQAIDEEIQGVIGYGQLVSASSTIRKHGAIDSKRLKNSRETIRAELNGDNAGSIAGQLRVLRSEDSAAFNILFPDVEERAQILVLDSLNQIRGESLQDTWRYLQSNPKIDPPILSFTQKKELDEFKHDSDTSSSMRLDVQNLYNSITSYGVDHKTAMESIEAYRDSDPYKLNLDNYSDTSKTHMEYHLKSFKKSPDSKLYEDPNTGVIYEEDSMGGKSKIIDKQGLYNFSNNMSRVKQYNKDHWVRKGFENKMDTFSTWVGGVVSTEMQNAKAMAEPVKNAGSFINYYFNTEIRTDGSVVKRDPWKAPYELNPKPKAPDAKRTGKDPYAYNAKERTGQDPLLVNSKVYYGPRVGE